MERAEAAVYRQLAQRRDGEEREILLPSQRLKAAIDTLARLLGEHAGMPKATSDPKPNAQLPGPELRIGLRARPRPAG